MQEGALHGGMVSVAFEKLPAWDGRTFRGARYTPKQFKAMKPGSELPFTAFASSSLNEEKARDFANMDGAPGFTVRVLFVMNVHNGRDIQSLAASETEQEIVLPPGSRFRVTEVEKSRKTSGREPGVLRTGRAPGHATSQAGQEEIGGLGRQQIRPARARIGRGRVAASVSAPCPAVVVDRSSSDESSLSIDVRYRPMSRAAASRS